MFEVAYKEGVLKKCFVYPNFIINSQKKTFSETFTNVGLHSDFFFETVISFFSSIL